MSNEYKDWLRENRNERDKFLTEAMGLKWHDLRQNDCAWWCDTCDVEDSIDSPYIVYHQSIDFSTWKGFGKLWGWSKQQEWWADFIDYSFDVTDWNFSWIHPDRFAHAVYKFLKGANQ